MSILTVSNLTKSFGERTLFKNISFRIDEGMKIGLIGANGVGKTTLFRILMGDEEKSGGEVYISKSQPLVCMEQTVTREKITVYDYTLEAFKNLTETEEELREIATELENEYSETLAQKYAEKNDIYIKSGGSTYRSIAKQTLIGLGFSEDELDKDMSVLSGGQVTRASLARILLSDSALMLLDEPTNHLDLKSLEFLENFLKNTKKAFVVISHDRYFLDSVTNVTMELENNCITEYKGSYSDFIKKKDAKFESDLKKYEQTKKEISRIEGIIDQQRSFGRERNFVTIQSKQKSIDRLKENLIKPEKNTSRIKFKFHLQKESGNDVLRIKNLKKSFGEKTLFQDFSFELHKRERVFVIGENGCGKSTLLKIIAKVINQDDGEILYGSKVEKAFYDQSQEDLIKNKTVISNIWDEYPKMTETEVRNALASFLIRGDDVYKEVSLISGGEKARVSLLKTMLKGANLLLLDEPTNHLDIYSKEALENALDDYDGTILAVSHDRYLINKFADVILAFEKNKIRVFRGNFDSYTEFIEKMQKDEVIKAPQKKVSDYEKQKELRRAKQKKDGAIKRTEEKIEKAEMIKQDLEKELETLTDDYQKIMEVTQKIEETENLIKEYMEEWENLFTSE